MPMDDFITILIGRLNLIEVKGERNLDLLLSVIQAFKGLQDGSIISPELKAQIEKERTNARNNQDSRCCDEQS